VLLAATSSAAGYAVLLCSRLAIIREFGGLLAATVVLALAASACVVTLTVRIENASTPTENVPAESPVGVSP
jgi:predicted RND superfamily exporter protein